MNHKIDIQHRGSWTQTACLNRGPSCHLEVGLLTCKRLGQAYENAGYRVYFGVALPGIQCWGDPVNLKDSPGEFSLPYEMPYYNVTKLPTDRMESTSFSTYPHIGEM